MSQVRAVVESQPAPSIRRVHRKPRVALERSRKWVKTIIMAGRSVRDIPRRGGIIQSIRICVAVPNRRIALVRMDMARQDQINRVFEENWLKCLSTLFAHVTRGARHANIPRPVARCTKNQFLLQARQGKLPTNNNPWRLLSVNRGQVCLQPVYLSILVAAKRSTIFHIAATWRIGANQSMAQVRLRVELDVVDHAMVKRVPKVTGTLGLCAWHAEVIFEAGEIRLTGQTDGYGITYVMHFIRCTAIVA